MENAEFYISFTGPASRFPVLSQFFDRLVAVKSKMPEIPAEFAETTVLILDPAWIDLLDSEAFDKVTTSDSWALEDILDCLLNGEYWLVNVTFSGETGRLVYDPWAYPFGGTAPLKAFVRMFGFEVSRDSFEDGFAESQQRKV
jgi:hypothetical protein